MSGGRRPSAHRLEGITERIRAGDFSVAATVCWDPATRRACEIQLNREGRAKGVGVDLLLDEIGLRLSRALQGRDPRDGQGLLRRTAGAGDLAAIDLGCIALGDRRDAALVTVTALSEACWRDLQLLTDPAAEVGIRRLVAGLGPDLAALLRRAEAEARGERR